MATKSKAQLLTDLAANFPDNNNKEITAARYRTFITDLVDSIFLKLTGGISIKYDPSKTYAIGDVAVYQGSIYEANTSTTGVFTPADWDELTAGTALTNGNATTANGSAADLGGDLKQATNIEGYTTDESPADAKALNIGNVRKLLSYILKSIGDITIDSETGDVVINGNTVKVNNDNRKNQAAFVIKGGTVSNLLIADTELDILKLFCGPTEDGFIQIQHGGSNNYAEIAFKPDPGTPHSGFYGGQYLIAGNLSDVVAIYNYDLGLDLIFFGYDRVTGISRALLGVDYMRFQTPPTISDDLDVPTKKYVDDNDTYKTVQNAGTPITQRANLNATGRLKATDDSGNDRTDLDLSDIPDNTALGLLNNGSAATPVPLATLPEWVTSATPAVAGEKRDRKTHLEICPATGTTRDVLTMIRLSGIDLLTAGTTAIPQLIADAGKRFVSMLGMAPQLHISGDGTVATDPTVSIGQTGSLQNVVANTTPASPAANDLTTLTFAATTSIDLNTNGIVFNVATAATLSAGATLTAELVLFGYITD